MKLYEKYEEQGDYLAIGGFLCVCKEHPRGEEIEALARLLGLESERRFGWPPGRRWYVPLDRHDEIKAFLEAM